MGTRTTEEDDVEGPWLLRRRRVRWIGVEQSRAGGAAEHERQRRSRVELASRTERGRHARRPLPPSGLLFFLANLEVGF
jgi:hypothetical protein